MTTQTTKDLLQEAKRQQNAGNIAAAEKGYVALLEKQVSPTDDAGLRDQEIAVNALGKLYHDTNNIQALSDLVRRSKQFTSAFSKGKTAKIVRELIDLFSDIPGALDTQISVTRECIDWAVETKRTFLRQNLEIRLIVMLHESGKNGEALKIIAPLLKELRKLDDKMQLVEVQLLESKIYHSLRNLPKSKAALTSTRTAANAIYCPPLLQASLDLQSGILHADDKDYKTAYSYFYEALEGFSSQEDPRAIDTLKYMLLSKIMLGATDDVESILSSKIGSKYSGPAVEAMRAISKAYQDRVLNEFNNIVEQHKEELKNDPVIRSHLSGLYDALLENNLIKIIEPFSQVEISHIAKLIGLGITQVEDKLSQMILDKVISAVLDQGAGFLVIYDEPESDKTYEAALDTLQHMSTVVDLLYEKARKLSAV